MSLGLGRAAQPDVVDTAGAGDGCAVGEFEPELLERSAPTVNRAHLYRVEVRRGIIVVHGETYAEVRFP